MKIVKFYVFLAMAFLVAGNSFAGNLKKDIKFAPGTTSATMDDGIARGDNYVYAITAKAGQTMEVAVTSVEKNAVFAIYLPGAKFVKVDGDTELKGATLQKAGAEDDAKSWSGKLPKSGKYLIVVGSTRGGADYKLKVTIK